MPPSLPGSLAKYVWSAVESLTIDLDRRRCRFDNLELAEGDRISLDGNTGAIYLGVLPVLQEQPEHELAAVASWRKRQTADRAKRE